MTSEVSDSAVGGSAVTGAGEISIRRAGRCGRITLNRPDALNALTHAMVRAIDAALRDWRTDDAVAMLVIDAVGDRAFCAGGDIAQMYATGRASDYTYGRAFWREEYAMNARLFRFPKPVASFLHGFTMGGGVGVGCHASHRVVCDTSRIAMPECGIGLIPDVGGSLLLARAPGALGEYLATTATRMGPADAIHAGFADHLVPRERWAALIAALEATGEPGLIGDAATPPGPGDLVAIEEDVARAFAGKGLSELVVDLAERQSDFARKAGAALARVSPLSAAAALMLVRRVRRLDTIEGALAMEYRFTHRAMEHGDFLEGIRAAIIDKDGRPAWRHDDPGDAEAAAAAMLQPLGEAELQLEDAG